MLWLPLALHGSKLFQFRLAHAFLHAPRLAESAAPAAFCCAFDFAGMEISSVKTQQIGMSEKTTCVLEGSRRPATEQSHTLAN